MNISGETTETPRGHHSSASPSNDAGKYNLSDKVERSAVGRSTILKPEILLMDGIVLLVTLGLLSFVCFLAALHGRELGPGYEKCQSALTGVSVLHAASLLRNKIKEQILTLRDVNSWALSFR